MRVRSVRGFVVCAVLAAAAAGSSADPGGMNPGDRASATLDGGGETKTASVRLVRGAVLSASARGLAKSGVSPTLGLADPAGVARDLDGQGLPRGSRASFSRVECDVTGDWLLSVTTPQGRGGAFELSVKAKQPSAVALSGAVTDGTGLAEFDAAAGSEVELTVTMDSRDAAAPSVEVRDPFGAATGFVPGEGRRTRLPPLVLAETGTYTVAVGGTTGGFRVTGKIRRPKPRKLEWKDAEAVPRIGSFTPQASANDTAVDFHLSGTAFSTRQVVQIAQGNSTRKAAAIDALESGGARVAIDLSGVPPGTYSLRVSTPAGNTAVADQPLVISNRRPAFLSYRPVDPPWAPDTVLVVDGAGFDATSTVTMKVAADGSAVPVSVRSRTGHGRLDLEIDPLPYQVGPCEIDVTDPDGSRLALPVELDILGLRSAPVDVWSIQTGATPVNDSYPRRTAWDTARDRVCLAIRSGSFDVQWILVDPVTLERGATLLVQGGGTRLTDPRVTYHPADDTYALSWRSLGTTQYARVRIVRASDLSTVSDLSVDSASRIYEIDTVANTAAGGWLSVWHRWNGSTASPAYLAAQRISAAGALDAAGAVLFHSAPNGLAAYPATVEAAADRFVVAHLGLADDGINWAIRRAVVTGGGLLWLPSAEAGSSALWDFAFQPEMVRNPQNGDILLAYTTQVGGVYHPAVQRLTGESWSPTPVLLLDSDGAQPVGFIDSLAWNPARDEYVIGTTAAPGLVVVRRMGLDGRMKGAPVLEQYDGIWGVLWSGPSAGQLGFFRMWDGQEDGEYRPGAAGWIRASRIW